MRVYKQKKWENENLILIQLIDIQLYYLIFNPTFR